MPLTPEQRKVLRTILAVGRAKGASPREMKAAVETAIVEANISNPAGGDADSAGWRQERASLYPNPTNVRASAARFFDEARKLNTGKGSAGDLAARVQRPAAQYRGRYQQVSSRAEALLGGNTSPGSPDSSTSTSTVGGVDNSGPRKQAIVNFLLDNSKSKDPLDLAVRVKQLADVPGQQVSTPNANASSTPASSGRSEGMSKLLELFYQGPGGIDVKNGQKVPQGFVAGHTDHVHVAAGPKTVVRLGKLAQSMGLTVGENSHFNGGHSETSGHAPDSYHYKDQAIDVSGPPDLMRKYARKVASMYHIR